MTFESFEELANLEYQVNQLQNRINNASVSQNTTSNASLDSDGYPEYLDKNISPFIEDNIELIDDNNFTELYKRADSWITGDYEHAKPYLTDYLLSCDINPLEYMKKVPEEYISTRESTFKIPDNIEVIEAESIRGSNLKHIILPKNLKQISLRLNIYNNNDLYLHYPGKESDWKSVCVIEGMDGREYDVYVTCEEDGYKQKYGKPKIDVSNVAYNSKWDWGSLSISKTLDDMRTRWDLKLDDLKDTYKSYFDED